MLSIRQDSLLRFQALIDGATRITVLGHTHPDGDALGCTGALAGYLREVRGKEAAVVLPDTPADNLRFIVPPSCPLLCHDKEPQASRNWIAGSNLIVLLDCNGFSRTEALEPFLTAAQAPKVLIDHHLNPQRESFDVVFSTPDISSASELLYWILKGLNNLEGGAPKGTSAIFSVTEGALPSGSSAISSVTEGALPSGSSAISSVTEGTSPSGSSAISIGTCLLAGMTTDTNNFANSVYPSTLQMASELLALGVDRDALLLQLYSSYRENRVRLFGYMQEQELRILGGAACMILTRELQQRFDVREGETEGLVNIPLSIAEVRLSIFLKEDDGHFRVSIRSKKGTSAQQLAMQYFHGGGHENAAGGKLFIGQDIARADEAAAYVESALKSFLS